MKKVYILNPPKDINGKLIGEAKRACLVPRIVTEYDVTRVCAPRGEAAQDSFERDLGWEESEWMED